MRALIYIGQGLEDEAWDWASEHQVTAVTEPTYLNEFNLLTLAPLSVARGRVHRRPSHDADAGPASRGGRSRGPRAERGRDSGHPSARARVAPQPCRGAGFPCPSTDRGGAGWIVAPVPRRGRTTPEPARRSRAAAGNKRPRAGVAHCWQRRGGDADHD